MYLQELEKDNGPRLAVGRSLQLKFCKGQQQSRRQSSERQDPQHFPCGTAMHRKQPQAMLLSGTTRSVNDRMLSCISSGISRYLNGCIGFVLTIILLVSRVYLRISSSTTCNEFPCRVNDTEKLSRHPDS